MYQDLLEMERRIDWSMMRKRMEIQDALGRVPTVSGFLRFLPKEVGQNRFLKASPYATDIHYL